MLAVLSAPIVTMMKNTYLLRLDGTRWAFFCCYLSLGVRGLVVMASFPHLFGSKDARMGHAPGSDRNSFILLLSKIA
jgi:hypothetical protein